MRERYDLIEPPAEAATTSPGPGQSLPCGLLSSLWWRSPIVFSPWTSWGARTTCASTSAPTRSKPKPTGCPVVTDVDGNSEGCSRYHSVFNVPPSRPRANDLLAQEVLDDHVETVSGHVSISTMSVAKGLEFRAVVVMACDDEIIHLQERIEAVGDDADLKEVYDTERHLL